MPDILDDRENHWLVLKDDGSTEVVSKTDRNRLLFEHGLSDVFRDRDEGASLTISDEEDTVTVSPLHVDDAAFHIISNDYDYTVPENEVDALIEIVAEAYDKTEGDEPKTWPIVDKLRQMMDTDVNPKVVDPLADATVFETEVEVKETGWLIHEHLLLTYDNELYNVLTESRTLSGGQAKLAGAKQQAYDVDTPSRRRFEDALPKRAMPEDLEFILLAVWAVDHTEPP